MGKIRTLPYEQKLWTVPIFVTFGRCSIEKKMLVKH